MKFIKYNANPKGWKTGDCVVRGIAVGTQQTWEQVYDDLVNIGRKKCRMPNEEIVYSKYLKDKVGGTVRYGVKIAKNDSNPATRCTYILDAAGMTPAHMDFTTGEFDYGDWKDAWFVRRNYPCMVKSNGEIDYKLNPNNYALKASGGASDYNNLSYDGNAMAAMPLSYLYLYEDKLK